MFEKTRRAQRAYYVLAHEWSERQRKVDPSTQRVTNGLVSCEEISKLQLDPNVCTIERMLEAGKVIDPIQVRNLLNVTDFADIESLNTQKSMNVYKYLKEHESEILSSVEQS